MYTAALMEAPMEQLMEIYDALLNAYGRRHWWPARSPFEMMVGAVLTQNTTWSNVEKAINNFGDKLTPEFIATAEKQELAQIIRPSGYYNQKTIKLKALTYWYSGYSYDVQKVREVEGQILRQELLSVYGIGPETADSILLYAFDKEFFVVDTYTRRIFKRLGYDIPDKYDSLRLKIQAHIPGDVYLYNEFHALIVEHAKGCCQKTPSCKECPLENICKKHLG